jgi:hypothetical protein
MARALHRLTAVDAKSMTLRIDRVEGRVQLSGDFRSEHVHQVKAELDRCQSPVALDLEEVGLVDVEAIRFLNSCEAAGVSVLHGSAYIRACMSQERERPEEQPKGRKGRQWKRKRT